MAIHGHLWKVLTKQREQSGLRIKACLVVPEITRSSVCVDWNKLGEKQ